MKERKELIERLRLDYTASSMAIALMKQAADALQSQAERIKELEAEAEQLRKGHFDASEANAALRSKLKGITICTVKGHKMNIIKPWHERVALIDGVLTTHHIRDAMQAEIDDLRNCMATDQMLIEAANASAERMMIERDKLRRRVNPSSTVRGGAESLRKRSGD